MFASRAYHALIALATILLLSTQSHGLLVAPASTQPPASLQAPIAIIHPPANHTPYQLLLSIEAGGFKGVIQTYLIQRVRDSIKDAMVERGYVPDTLNATDFDIDLADWFPAMAGSSIGAVQALYYATRGGTTLAKALVQAQNARPGSPEAAIVFFDLLGQTEGAYSPHNGTDAAQLLKAASANSDSTRRLLQTIFGNMTLGALNTSMYITTTDPAARAPLDVVHDVPTNVTGWLQYVINNTAPQSPVMQLRPGVDFDLADVALASSTVVPQALPVQLVSRPGGNESSQLNRTVIDGAFATSNPVAAALGWLLRRVPRDDVAVLSIGTGDATVAADGPTDVYKSLLSSPGHIANLLIEAGVQKAAHAAAESMLLPDDPSDSASPLGSPPRLLRLDFLAQLQGNESPVPGLTAAELVEALEGGYAKDADTYQVVGQWMAAQFANEIDDFVRAYVVPPLAGAAPAPAGRSRR